MGGGTREQCGRNEFPFPKKPNNRSDLAGDGVVAGGGVGGWAREAGGGLKSVIPASAVTWPTRQCMMSICSRF